MNTHVIHDRRTDTDLNWMTIAGYAATVDRIYTQADGGITGTHTIEIEQFQAHADAQAWSTAMAKTHFGLDETLEGVSLTIERRIDDHSKLRLQIWPLDIIEVDGHAAGNID